MADSAVNRWNRGERELRDCLPDSDGRQTSTKTIKQVDSKLADRFWAIADLNVYP